MKNNDCNNNNGDVMGEIMATTGSLLESYGGKSSSTNPLLKARLLEELSKYYPQITDEQLSQAREYLNNHQ